MQIDHLGIHESVKSVFPPTELQRCLAEMERDLTIEVVSDELEYCDALVTILTRKNLLKVTSVGFTLFNLALISFRLMN